MDQGSLIRRALFVNNPRLKLFKFAQHALPRLKVVYGSVVAFWAVKGLVRVLDNYEDLMQPMFLRLGGEADQVWMDDIVAKYSSEPNANQIPQVQTFGNTEVGVVKDHSQAEK